MLEVFVRSRGVARVKTVRRESEILKRTCPQGICDALTRSVRRRQRAYAVSPLAALTRARLLLGFMGSPAAATGGRGSPARLLHDGAKNPGVSKDSHGYLDSFRWHGHAPTGPRYAARRPDGERRSGRCRYCCPVGGQLPPMAMDRSSCCSSWQPVEQARGFAVIGDLVALSVGSVQSR